MTGYMNPDGSELVGGQLPSGQGQALQLDNQGNLKTTATLSASANQRVNMQAGDMAAGAAVAGAFADGAITTLGAEADVAWSLTGNATVIALLKKLDLLIQYLSYDNTNELKTSLYGKHSAAGDTAVAVDGSGNVMETLATLIAGENLVTNRLNVEPIYSYYVISSAATTTVKSGAGTFHVLNILGGTLGAITVYDNTAGSGTLIVPTFTPSGPMSILLDQSFLTGLTIVTAAATMLNIGYR